MYLKEQRGLGRRSRRAAAVITAAAACLVATGCSSVASVTNSAASKQAPQPTASAASTGTSGPGLKLSGAPAASAFGQATAQAVAASPAGPPADPFSGTPADDWADNSAGLVYPAGAPIGPFTRAEVEDAYVMTALLLLTANLDRPVLFSGAPPTKFANLLTSRQKAWFLGGLDKKGVDKQGNPLSTRTLVMSFVPGSAQLVGDTIKVNGAMHAKAVKDSNGAYELDVDVDFTFVYPVEPPDHPDDWMRVVNEVVWTVAFADWQGAASSFAPWVTPVSGKGRVSGIVCGTGDGYWRPAYPVASAAASSSASPTGAPVDPYVSGQARPESCQAITGT